MKRVTGKRTLLLCYLLAAALVGLDQLTKALVRGNIAQGEHITLIPGVVGLTYVRNTGMAFSALSGWTGLLALGSLAVSVLLVIAMWVDYFHGTAQTVLLALVLGGAVGNLIDRAALGYVTDMIEVLFFSFPVFNVADSCICVGVALLAVWVLFFDKSDQSGGQNDGSPKNKR